MSGFKGALDVNSIDSGPDSEFKFDDIDAEKKRRLKRAGTTKKEAVEIDPY